jgi:hypothetical protein
VSSKSPVVFIYICRLNNVISLIISLLLEQTPFLRHTTGFCIPTLSSLGEVRKSPDIPCSRSPRAYPARPVTTSSPPFSNSTSDLRLCVNHLDRGRTILDFTPILANRSALLREPVCCVVRIYPCFLPVYGCDRRKRRSFNLTVSRPTQFV